MAARDPVSPLYAVDEHPLALQGTVRENLDPMKLHKDKDMIAVLRAVQLWDILCGIGLSLRKTPTRPVQAVAAHRPMAIAATSSVPLGKTILPRARSCMLVASSLTTA